MRTYKGEVKRGKIVRSSKYQQSAGGGANLIYRIYL